MSQEVAIVSKSSLENWSWRTPWVTGIGGSESGHIEASTRLFQRGFQVRSFTPAEQPDLGPTGLIDRPLAEFDASNFKVVVNYRHLPVFDAEKPKGAVWWFIAQDVEYGEDMTDERLDKIDRYICLCKTHADFTMSKYPRLRGKVFISSNGVRSAFIEALERDRGAVNPATGETVTLEPRIKNRLLYASSPDRGLKLLLQNWFRIREKVPDAELRVAYGFDNVKKIVALMGGNDWRVDFHREMEDLLQQPGVTFTGRLNQLDLYKEWFSAGVWFHPSDWPETSCITVMDAMATGCWPVSNNFWAVGEHLQRVGAGDLFYGVPQKSALVKSYMIEKACERLNDGVLEINRLTMAEKARRVYDWEKIVDQWQKWLEADLT